MHQTCLHIKLVTDVKVAREKNGVYVLHKRFVQEEAEIKVRS